MEMLSISTTGAGPIAAVIFPSFQSLHAGERAIERTNHERSGDLDTVRAALCKRRAMVFPEIRSFWAFRPDESRNHDRVCDPASSPGWTAA